MKVNKKIVNQRRNHILLSLQTNKKVLVEDLSKELNVSPLTIRRDLQVLEDEGLIIRFYGGARIIETPKELTADSSQNDILLHSIAKKAATFIEDGDTIFINTSRTALALLHYIKNKRVTVITNNGKAIHTDRDPNVSVFLTGGELRTPKESLTGEFALANLNKITATKCFLGCSGITQDNITTAVPQEVAINECMINRTSKSVFILADYTKIGSEYSFISGSTSDVNVLITDYLADEDTLHKIKNKNIKVYQVHPQLNSKQ